MSEQVNANLNGEPTEEELMAASAAIKAYKFFAPKSQMSEVKQKLRSLGFITDHLEHTTQILYIDPVYLDGGTDDEKREAVQHDVLADEFDDESNADYEEITVKDFLEKDNDELWPGFFTISPR